MYTKFEEFAMHLDMHNFGTPIGFLFVQLGIEKKQPKHSELLITSKKDLKVLPSVCAFILVT